MSDLADLKRRVLLGHPTPGATLALIERCRVLEVALARIDHVLTTASGDNVPRGEACKTHARLIARNALEQPGPPHDKENAA